MWIQMATGGAFDLREPRAELVSPLDILGQLPFLPCFTGAQAYLRFEHLYSVAQHSLLVSHVLEGSGFELAGLLHDAHKIYTMDATLPLGLMLNEMSEGRWKKYRGRIESAVAERFGLPYPLPDAVEEADLLARSTEVRDILAPQPMEWDLVKLPEPLAERIVPLPPAVVRRRFAERWKALDPNWPSYAFEQTAPM